MRRAGPTPGRNGGGRAGEPLLPHQGCVQQDTVQINGCDLISYTSFDYLGLARVSARRCGSQGGDRLLRHQASASRLVGGNNSIVEQLDATLASFLGVEAAVSMPSGYGVNASVLGHLFGSDDLILYDELAHNSIVQGAMLSQATRRTFPHNDLDFVDKLLARSAATIDGWSSPWTASTAWTAIIPTCRG